MSAVQQCCGEEFTNSARKGWVKIFSRMFDIILPIVVTYEMKICGELMTTVGGPRTGPKTISVNREGGECPIPSAANSLRSNDSNKCPV